MNYRKTIASFALAGLIGVGGWSTAAMAAATAKLHQMLPEAIQKSGVVRVASDIEYPPFETYAADGKTVVGIDADLLAEAGKLLGVKFKFINSSFDAIIPGLIADRYDMAISAMTDTKVREKQVDFVDYFKSGGAILARTADKDKYTTLDSLCGVTVGVDKGTTEVKDANEQTKKCVKEGKKPLTIRIFASQNQMVLALHTNRVDAVLADGPNAGATAKHSNGSLVLTAPPYTSSLFGVVFPKKNTQLRDAVAATVQAMIDNGSYMKILKKYGLDKFAIDKVTVNNAQG